MSQDLIAPTNTQPYVSPGDLVWSGNISSIDYQLPITLSPGAYMIGNTQGGSCYIISPSNYGNVPFSTLNSLTVPVFVLRNSESNLRISFAWNLFDSNRWIAGTTSFSGANSTNLIYDNNNYMFAGNFSTAATLFYSTDTINWSTRSLGTALGVYNVLAAQGSARRRQIPNFLYSPNTTNKYVITLSTTATTNNTVYSTDAVTWTLTSCNLVTDAVGNTGLAVNTNLANPFIMKGTATNQTNTIATSTDAVTWTSRATAHASSVSIDYLAGNGAASGEVYVYTCGNTTNNIGTSTDGITWTSRTTGVTNEGGAVIWFVDKWVVTHRGNGLQYCTSTDAITWTIRNTVSGLRIFNTTADMVNMTVVNNLLFVPQQDFYNNSVLLYSTDAITWSAFGIGFSALPTVYNNDNYYGSASSRFVKAIDPIFTSIYKLDKYVPSV
jgi:hypothetical protein